MTKIRRAVAKQETTAKPVCETTLTAGEQSVLKVFRQYLMTPGQMLCFYGPTLTNYSKPLTQLINKQMLIAERFRGGYSLTLRGFTAMKHSAAPR